MSGRLPQQEIESIRSARERALITVARRYGINAVRNMIRDGYTANEITIAVAGAHKTASAEWVQ